jgi:HK97 family phage prohead protease
MHAEREAAPDAARETGRPPRDNLVRAARNVTDGLRAVAVRAEPQAGDAAATDAGGMPTLYGYFTRFDEWTEIDSWFEGNFLERLVSGSFKKTFREQTPKVLFQHGMDGMCGDKPLGPPDVLREESDGPYYEVPLLDTTYVRDLVPGLEAGLYGASFRFSVMREEWVEDPGVSDHNPKGLPERTIKEVRCSEFGPVTFPAYPGATAAVRSMTDEWIAARMTTQPEPQVRAVLAYLERRDSRLERDTAPDDGATAPDEDATAAPAVTPAPPKDRAEAEPHPVEGRRDTPTTEGLYGLHPFEEKPRWKI